MKRFAILLSLVAGLLTVHVSLAQDIANWTILHYTAVDNDLEAPAFNDYYEMQSVGSGNGVNIVGQLDRAEGYENRFGDWTDTRRFFIEYVPPLPELDPDGKREAVIAYFVAQGYGDEASLRKEAATLDDAAIASIYENNLNVSFDQTPLEELGEVDMGDPQALFDFIVWGATNFPAEHYMIVIGTHGGGWRGLGPDHGGGEDSMLELPEIDEALAAARDTLGVAKFDIVGFDACLMGVMDVAMMLEPHADYMLFSQEVIPGNGWEYTSSIRAMQANPGWDTFQVAANFIDNYMAYYAGPGDRTKIGLSLVETAGLPTLVASLDNFAQVVGGDTVSLLSALGTARNNSQLFGTSLGDRADVYSYVDLRDFMTWFSLQTTITEDAYFAAQEVLAAYDQAVVYALADDRLPGATGLALYLPSTPLAYASFGGDYPAVAPANFAFWQDYLNQFYSTIVSELDGSALQLAIASVFTVYEPGVGSLLDNPVVFFDAAGAGVIDLAYTVTNVQDDGTRIIVDTSPISYTTTLPTGETVIEYPNELTPSTFTWSAEFPVLTDGTTQVLSVVQANSGSGNEGIVSGTYVTAEGSLPAYLVFDIGTREYIGLLAIADEAPFEVNPNPGDQFIVDLILISPDGEVSINPQADAPLTFGVEPFVLSYEPAVSGNYELGLTMRDLADNQVYQSTQFIINHDGLDDTLRGFTDTNTGVYFLYPRAWGDSFSLTNEDESETTAVGDRDGIQTLYVDSYPDTDALTALEIVISGIDGDISEISETSLGGLNAYTAIYQVETETGPVIGYVISVFHDPAGAALVLTLESASGDADSDAAIIELLNTSLQLFSPVE